MNMQTQISPKTNVFIQQVEMTSGGERPRQGSVTGKDRNSERPNHKSRKVIRWRCSRATSVGGAWKFHLEMASARTFALPLMWETSKWIPVDVAVTHNFSKKKARGVLVVNRELIPASAPVLSDKLEIRRAYRCAGMCCVTSFTMASCASVS